MDNDVFAKAVYVERLNQLILIPYNVNASAFYSTGVYSVEKAEYLLTVMGLNIPIEVDSRSVGSR